MAQRREEKEYFRTWGKQSKIGMMRFKWETYVQTPYRHAQAYTP